MHFKIIQQSFFFGLLALVSLSFLFIIHDFLMPIFWAIVFAILFNPLQQKWLSVTKKRASFSSFLTIVTILLIVFVPLSIVGSLVLKESVDFYQQLSTTNTEGVQIDFLEKITVVSRYLEDFGVEEAEFKERVTAWGGQASRWLASQAVVFGQSTFSVIVQFFVMIYILFFMFRDGPAIEKWLIHILPLGDHKERRLFARFVSTTRAVIKGTLVIGIIQGAIGGILFWVAGIKGAVLWAVLMTLLSVIPAVGPALVWLPAGILLLLTGSLWQGILILAGGAVIISLIDNILRPRLVGKDTQMPDTFILISTLGGLSIFGITGFVIGPIVAGFFIAMWHMFEEQYRRELELHG